MSHVDKGALHAYLDGALDEYPALEARRVREHLDACNECARHLEEERAVREDAREILALAAPSVEAPPLEELRSLARSGAGLGEARPRLKLYRLGWAASVVLAVGAGWMLRGQQGLPLSQEFQSPGTREQEAVTEQLTSDPTSQPDGFVAAGEASADAPGQPSTRGSEMAREGFARAPLPVSTPIDLNVPAPTADVGQDLDFADVTNALENRPPELEAPSEVLPTDVAAVDELLTAATLQERRDEALPNRPDDRAASSMTGDAELQRLRAEVQVAGGAGGIGAAEVAAPPAAPTVGRRRLNADGSAPGSLSVPGLEVVEVTFLDDGRAPTGVRILQRLEEGDTLELIHLPEGVDPGSLTGPAVQVEELRVPRDAGWLIMRAPIARVRLEELLMRLDSIR